MVESVTEGSSRHPGSAMVRRYAILAYGVFGTIADVALMVLGSLLVGLSVAVLLGGFGLADVLSDEITTGGMLISAIVLAVIGLFCLGVASEGPLGRGRRLVGFSLWEIGIGRIVAAFVTGLIAVLIYGFLGGILEGVPSPMFKGTEGIRAVGVAGMTVMPILGVPLSLAVSLAPDEYAWAREADIPVLFVVWAVASMIILT
jgi:hypothetical protein